MPVFMKLGDIKGDVVASRTESTMVATELLSTGSGGARIGLLLPAVQKVREAAARSSAGSTGATNLQAPPQAPQLIGLLLPAVQKVREAAARSNHGALGTITQGGTQTAGLLLPAVQKVREAAARKAGGAVAVHLHSAGNAGVFNSIKQTKVVNATLTLPDGTHVELADALVFDVAPAGRGLDVVLGFGRAWLHGAGTVAG